MTASQALLKAIVECKVADSLQYWESTLDYLDSAELDLKALRSLLDQFPTLGKEWHKELNEKRALDYLPVVVGSYFGVQVLGDAGVTIVIRSLINHLHKAFDTLAQFVNCVALGDSGLDPEDVNVWKVLKEIQKYPEFEDLATALENLSSNKDCFQYVVDLDNTLKHLLAVEPDVKWFIFPNTVEAYFPGFRKQDRRTKIQRQYPRRPLLATATQVVQFASDTVTNFERIVCDGCGAKWKPLVDKRYDRLWSYVQFENNEGKHITGMAQFLPVTDLPRPGEVLRVLSLVKSDIEGEVHYSLSNSPADFLILRNADNVPIGIAEATEAVSQDDEIPILVYREYIVRVTGRLSAMDMLAVIENTTKVVGFSRVVYGLPAGTFLSSILTGKPDEK